jgi:hypothetical protein
MDIAIIAGVFLTYRGFEAVFRGLSVPLPDFGVEWVVPWAREEKTWWVSSFLAWISGELVRVGRFGAKILSWPHIYKDLGVVLACTILAVVVRATCKVHAKKRVHLQASRRELARVDGFCNRKAHEIAATLKGRYGLCPEDADSLVDMRKYAMNILEDEDSEKRNLCQVKVVKYRRLLRRFDARRNVQETRNYYDALGKYMYYKRTRASMRRKDMLHIADMAASLTMVPDRVELRNLQLVTVREWPIIRQVVRLFGVYYDTMAERASRYRAILPSF